MDDPVNHPLPADLPAVLPAALARPRSRRQFLALAGSAAAAAAFLAACGEDDESDAPTATASSEATSATASTTATSAATAEPAPWTYTDARGKTVTLDRAPERVVAWVTLAAALYDSGVKSVGIFGPSTTDGGERTPQAGRLALDEVESLTNGYSEVDLERLAVLKPDIFFVAAYDGVIWPIEEQEINAIEQIVPIVAININRRPANEVLGDLADLAASLAAPRVEGAEAAVAEAKAEFEAASEALRAAAAAKPDLTMIVFSLSADTIWIANWQSLPDLLYFSELGVNFYPTNDDLLSDVYVPKLTWETVNTFQTDAILLDARPQWQYDESERAGTWGLLPAVQADQLGWWRAEVILSYQGVTPVLVEMTEQVDRFAPDVVAEAA